MPELSDQAQADLADLLADIADRAVVCLDPLAQARLVAARMAAAIREAQAHA